MTRSRNGAGARAGGGGGGVRGAGALLEAPAEGAPTGCDGATGTDGSEPAPLL
ncbi:MAG: hypothetical protein NZM10_04290 [Fimbriimonadales bacterium]|nr:hypothetical protein [Fimbriimonadales bacterium]